VVAVTKEPPPSDDDSTGTCWASDTSRSYFSLTTWWASGRPTSLAMRSLPLCHRVCTNETRKLVSSGGARPPALLLPTADVDNQATMALSAASSSASSPWNLLLTHLVVECETGPENRCLAQDGFLVDRQRLRRNLAPTIALTFGQKPNSNGELPWRGQRPAQRRRRTGLPVCAQIIWSGTRSKYNAPGGRCVMMAFGRSRQALIRGRTKV
jgi:hypothetical protein